MEVPQFTQEPHVLPVADAGQERVHQHHPLGGLRELRGIGIGHHQPDVVADDADAIELERRRELVDVHGHVPLVVSGGRLGRASGAAQVGHDDGVTLGEQRHERAPHVAGLGIAVQQDHRAAPPADEIAQPHAVDLGEALGEAGGLGGAPSGAGHSCVHGQGASREILSKDSTVAR